MSRQVTCYKVFIASPGGLEKERAAFKEVVSAHNQADAMARNCLFEPIGWEITLGGVGRPQEKINEELRDCDLLVLVLWDRWGSSTGSEEEHTSGTEEEFQVAQACLANPDQPMREIVVLFKAVDPRQLSDPGPQLSAVLEFKKKLEKEKSLLFETFDSAESFTEKIRKHLAKWTREHEKAIANGNPVAIEKKEPGKIEAEPLYSAIDIEDAELKEDPFVKRIEDFYSSGNLTDAEAQLVSEIMPRKSLQAFYEYGLFLLKSERLVDALSIFEEMHKLAFAGDELSWAATALAKIGGIYRMQNDFAKSQGALIEALKLNQEARNEKGEMLVGIWLGDLLWQFKRPAKALEVYESALQLASNFGNEKLIADLFFKIAKCLMSTKKVADSITHADKADAIYKKLGDKTSSKAVKSWRKSKVLR